MKIFMKRRFMVAFMEGVALLVGTIITYLCMSHLFHIESQYDSYRADGVEQTVTVASALGFVEDGEVATEDDISSFESFLIKKGIVAPQTILTVYNKEISYRTAKFITYYVFIGFVAGIICLAGGIGFPFRWRRRGTLMDKFDKMLVDYRSPTRYDWVLERYRYEGETFSGVVWLLFCFLLWFVAALWGLLLPLIIVLNIVIAIITIILRLVKFVILNIKLKKQRKKREKQTEKKTCSLVVDGSYFRAEQDQNHEIGLYLRQYWNAVIARRIMELEFYGRGGAFSEDDAKNYIMYGDEELHDYYEFNRRWRKITTCFDKELHIRDKRMKESCYRPVTQQTDEEANKCSLALFYENTCTEGTTVQMQNEKNFSLLCAVLEFDRNGKIFEMTDWKRWKKEGHIEM